MKKIIVALIIICSFISCKTITKTIEVPVEVVKKEYIHDVKIDSFIVKDSIDRYIKGDTCYIYKEHTKYQYLIRKDTVLKTDTIPKIVTTTIEKKVEVNHIYWWQKLLMWLGVIATVFSSVFITYKMKIKK